MSKTLGTLLAAATLFAIAGCPQDQPFGPEEPQGELGAPDSADGANEDRTAAADRRRDATEQQFRRDRGDSPLERSESERSNRQPQSEPTAPPVTEPAAPPPRPEL